MDGASMPSAYSLVLAATLAFSASALPAFAADTDQNSRETRSCSANTTVGIVDCIGALTRAWDRRLNRAYRIMLGRLGGPKKRAFNDAQILWIRYRDANCRYYAMGRGTITQIQAAECLRFTTARRACELEEMTSGIERSAAGPGCK
jgi:uncharacterized protein YecT (DUF1311 family)